MALKMGSFYERAGRVITLGSNEREGSVTVVGAVSPPGGDFSEPVTQASLKYGGALWALDTDLAYRRHFPAINWIKSYTLYTDHLRDWFVKNISDDWFEIRDRALHLLSREDELKEVVQLIGYDALQDKDRLIMEAGRLLREGFLRQNAFSSIDTFCTQEKQYLMLKVILEFFKMATESLDKGALIETIIDSPIIERLLRLSEVPESEVSSTVETLLQEIGKGIG